VHNLLPLQLLSPKHSYFCFWPHGSALDARKKKISTTINLGVVAKAVDAKTKQCYN